MQAASRLVGSSVNKPAQRSTTTYRGYPNKQSAQNGGYYNIKRDVPLPRADPPKPVVSEKPASSEM